MFLVLVELAALELAEAFAVLVASEELALELVAFVVPLHWAEPERSLVPVRGTEPVRLHPEDCRSEKLDATDLVLPLGQIPELQVHLVVAE